MRILLFSDIHGNVRALDAVLSDRHRRGPYDLVICAGDLFWAGPRPGEVMRRLRELCDDDPEGGSGVVCIQGNTDLFVLSDFAETSPQAKGQKRFRRHRDWMLAQLSAADLTFISRLPFSFRVSPAAGHDLLAVHANPRNLDDPIFAGMTDEQIAAAIGDLPPRNPVAPASSTGDFALLAYGHIHIPSLQLWRGRWLVNVASVGLPRDGDTRAAYSVLTWWKGAWQVEQYRVAYDVESVARDMEEREMPRGRHFARRLLAAQYD